MAAKTEKQLTRQKITALRKVISSTIINNPLNVEIVTSNLSHIPTDPTKPNPFDECIKCRTKDLKIIAEKLVQVLRPSIAKRVRVDKPSKKKQEYIDTVELLLANCSGAFMMSRDSNWYSKSPYKRYCDVYKDNVYPELRPLSRHIIDDLLKYLEKIGLIRRKTGSADFLRVNDSYVLVGSELTKITPCPELKELVKLLEFVDTSPVVLIRKKVGGDKFLISYHPEHFDKQIKTVSEFNRLLGLHDRTIHGETLPAPNLKRKFLYYGKEKTVLDDTQLLGGRFTGGVEGMKRIERVHLLHDGEETVEVDLSSCHATIAYNELLGVTPVEPYIVYDNQPDELRDIVKKTVNTALNCSSEAEVVGAITKIINNGELEVPTDVYDDLTEEGKERGKYYYTGAPDAEAARMERYWTLSNIIAATLQKHNELLQMVWARENYGVYLQRKESDIMAQMMDVAIQDHSKQSRKSTILTDTPEKFDIQIIHKNYSQCLIFEPIHDGVRVKKEHATRTQKLFESVCQKLGYDIKAEIKANTITVS